MKKLHPAQMPHLVPDPLHGGLDQIRVPFLWSPAGDQRGLVEGNPVSILDVAPTLVQAAGLEPSDTFRGVVVGSDARNGSRLLFAEHRIRAAVITGSTYYARDTIALDAPVPDRITGGLLPPLPARTARLTPDGGWPDYRQADMQGLAGILEPLVADHLRGVRDERGETIRLDPDTEAVLRSLGYVE